jgi:5-formyltetrahydrofolate cyclo-ligase
MDRRENLSTAYVQSYNQAILTRLSGLAAFTQATLVHTYVSAKTHEVDTHALIEHALANDKRVVVPQVQRTSPHLRHAQINALAQLRPGYFGLLQPTAGHSAWIEDLALIDLVLVPGLAFDRQGNRLGYGGGYYDRFLVKVTALKIGLVPEALIVDEIPCEPHDIPMDILLTDERTYHPSKGKGQP